MTFLIRKFILVSLLLLVFGLILAPPIFVFSKYSETKIDEWLSRDIVVLEFIAREARKLDVGVTTFNHAGFAIHKPNDTQASPCDYEVEYRRKPKSTLHALLVVRKQTRFVSPLLSNSRSYDLYYEGPEILFSKDGKLNSDAAFKFMNVAKIRIEGFPKLSGYDFEELNSTQVSEFCGGITKTSIEILEQ